MIATVQRNEPGGVGGGGKRNKNCWNSKKKLQGGCEVLMSQERVWQGRAEARGG